MKKPLRSYILSGTVLGLAMILAACGGGSGDDPTPTSPPTTTIAKPTQPPVNIPSTPETVVAESPTVVVATPDITVPVMMGTPIVGPVDLTGDDATPVAEVVPVSTIVWVVSDTPGDGTGGSGAPGERENTEPEVATPEVAGTPVAQLTIEGCELPHVPTYIGDSDQAELIEDVNFRSGPGVDCEPLLDEPLGSGQTVTVTGGPVTQAADGSEWVEIEVNGTRGWVSADFIDLNP